MNNKIEIQYVDKNPSELVEVANATIDNALNVFNELDWKHQLKLKESRSNENLSSPDPSIIISYNSQQLEILSSQLNFYLICHTYNNQIRTFELYIASNIQKGITLRDFLQAFFNGTLHEFEPVNEMRIEESFEKFGKFRPYKYSWVLLGYGIPLLPALIEPDEGKSSTDLLYVIFYFGIIWSIYMIPFVLIFINYISKPVVFYASYNASNNSLDLKMKNRIVTIKSDEIYQCVRTHYSKGNGRSHIWEVFENVVITLKDKKQYCLTTFTFSKGELHNILSKLKINAYTVGRQFQFINTSDFVERNTKNYNIDTSKLREKYSNFSTEKLRVIIKNKDNYQKQAVEIVESILKERREL